MLAAAYVIPALPSGSGVPCPLRTYTGIPCPLCGMTTSVTAAAHGHIGGALAANPVGVVALLAAIALLFARQVTTITVPTWLIPTALGAMWLFELLRFKVL